jgi:hypothetical protein
MRQPFFPAERPAPWYAQAGKSIFKFIRRITGNRRLDGFPAVTATKEIKVSIQQLHIRRPGT